jgi:predicted lipid-binding transport protein (Tim44 family)
MKTVLSLVMAVFLSISFAEPAEAKRFGSGGFGKAFKTSPFKKASPQKAIPGNGSNLAGNKAAGRKPGMGGLMGGLLAGGMFAYLLGSGAFEGIQFMDILLFALLGFVLFKVFAGRKQVHAHQQGYQGSPTSQPAHQAFESSNSSMGSGQDVPMDLPVDFDLAGFTSRAVEHYSLVHKAWDQADMSTVKEYLDESLYSQLEAERKQDSDILNNQILDLDAEIVRSQATKEGFILSVLFRGRMKDLDQNQEQGIYDVWHLEQTNGGPWLIVGIEAE